MKCTELLDKALKAEFLSAKEGQFLFEKAGLADLMMVANQLRKAKRNDGKVTWIIDRNMNTTNVCIANCKFCNFYRIPGHKEGYITDIETYKLKIDETLRYGGEQLLLQGGHHPEMGLKYYVELFGELKSLYPNLKLHALGPPEIAHICKLDGLSHTQVLSELKAAGLDSLPGAGAEILNDRVRRLISKGKCTGAEWLDVMRAAHQLDITTSATMMFGHIETIEERFEHLVQLRDVQSEKPESAKGFVAFIPWPFQDDGTLLRKVKGIRSSCTADEYVRTIAISRITTSLLFTSVRRRWRLRRLWVVWALASSTQPVGYCGIRSSRNSFGSVPRTCHSSPNELHSSVKSVIPSRPNNFAEVSSFPLPSKPTP